MSRAASERGGMKAWSNCEVCCRCLSRKKMRQNAQDWKFDGLRLHDVERRSMTAIPGILISLLICGTVTCMLSMEVAYWFKCTHCNRSFLRRWHQAGTF